ncbi:transcriptional regulator, LacI family [Streptomyces sp. SolWspMP-5a-2]|nr:transcriptional regulator, LacI family [Streptomyces sp. SolWspMP-5a-2]
MSRQAPTLEDVAREAGVSRATVSRVVNGVRNVDPAIQDLVRQAIARTGYAPNRAARSLVTRRTETVALVVSGAGDASEETQDVFTARVFADPFFGRVVSGVVGFLRPRSMHPVLMFAETEESREQVVRYLRQGSADGALVVSTHADDPLPARLAEAAVPAVLFARPARPVPLSYVDLAHRDGGRLAAEHLLAGGRRRVATVSGPLAVPASAERLDGFRAAMARGGHPGSPPRRAASPWRAAGRRSPACSPATRTWTGCSPGTT